VFSIEIDQPHHCTETGDGTHGEEEADSNLLRQAHLHLAQNNDRGRQNHEIEDNMDHAKGNYDCVGAKAMARLLRFP